MMGPVKRLGFFDGGGMCSCITERSTEWYGEKSNRDICGLRYHIDLASTLAPAVKSPVIVNKLLTRVPCL